MNERLKRALLIKGISQGELARRTGITAAAVSRYITGSREPRPKTLKKIAKVLGVSVDYLVGDERDE